MSQTIQRITVWSLTGRIETASAIQVFEIATLPYQIGRRSDLSLTLPSKMVSALHAIITQEGDSLAIQDLHSTNGTYVNGRPVQGKQHLKDGDLIQIADVALRLNSTAASATSQTQANTSATFDQALSLVQFDKLLSERAVIPHYQPIVSLPSREIVGYEALARSALFGLQSPKDMFLAASQLNLEEELSRILRLAGLEAGQRIPQSLALFVNTHPAEIVTFGFLSSLETLRRINPKQPVTMEVHESAVTDVDTMKKLRDALTDLDIQLAFDDFGAGQSRLVELTEVRPDLVKFDMHLIRDIDSAPDQQQQMLATLTRMVHELGIITLAEGVETEGEHATCCDIGFELAQGYFYGKPETVANNLSKIEQREFPV